MLKFATKLLISASFCLAAAAPVTATQVMPQRPAIQDSGSSPLIEIRHSRRGFYRHNRHGYYNGHRGYRHKRRGYRHYNGYWFPPAAFALGAIIGGALNDSRAVRPGYLNPRHVRWCDAKYRSYRARDNSFQPYHGPRRECRSPYY